MNWLYVCCGIMACGCAGVQDEHPSYGGRDAVALAATPDTADDSEARAGAFNEASASELSADDTRVEHAAQAGHDATRIDPDTSPDPFLEVAADDGQVRPRQELPSSFATCLCWPNGEVCDAEPGYPIMGPDEAFRCPEGEVCMGDPMLQRMQMRSVCARPCYHPDAEHRVDLDCTFGEECKVEYFRWGFEGQFTTTQAFCQPIRDFSEPQPDFDPKYPNR